MDNSTATKGLALIVLGLLINNVSYLYDMLVDKHEGWIFLGWKTQAGAAIGAIMIVAGLFLIWQKIAKAS